MLSAGVVGWEVARVELNKQGCRPVGAALAQGIKCAMGHCRLMVQQPKKFEQRARFLSCEEKAKLNELLTLYKQPKPGEVFVDSHDTEGSGRTLRQLRKVDTDDLGFSWPNGSGGSPPKKKANVQQAPMQKEATVQKQATAQVQLTRHTAASCLIEALSADPVNPALKQTLKKKQQVQCTKKQQRQATKKKRQWRRRSKKRLRKQRV